MSEVLCGYNAHIEQCLFSIVVVVSYLPSYQVVILALTTVIYDYLIKKQYKAELFIHVRVRVSVNNGDTMNDKQKLDTGVPARMSEQDQDLALVKRVQQGDKNAFNLLVKKYQNKIAGLISRYVSNQGDIADVAQEAFIKAYRAKQLITN